MIKKYNYQLIEEYWEDIEQKNNKLGELINPEINKVSTPSPYQNIPPSMYEMTIDEGELKIRIDNLLTTIQGLKKHLKDIEVKLNK